MFTYLTSELVDDSSTWTALKAADDAGSIMTATSKASAQDAIGIPNEHVFSIIGAFEYKDADDAAGEKVYLMRDPLGRKTYTGA